MRRLFLALAAVLIAASAAQAGPREREVEAVMDEYLRLWNAHDAAAITSRIYRFDGPNRMGERAGLEAEFARLKAQGYDHSDKISIEACLLTADSALAEFRFSRLKTDGTPLGPKDRATLYVLRRFPDGWRIVRLIPMSAGADLTCRSAS
jgi:hypothetical protein